MILRCALSLSLALASCLDSETVSCEFGVICPKGLLCEPIHQTCVRPGEPVCGNGQREDGEQCDDGSANSDDARDACRSDCTRARCGDGVIDSGEVCDIGADLSAGGCSPDCRSTEVCGNAYIDLGQGERCDDGNLRSGDGCTSSCQPEVLGWWEAAVASAPRGAAMLAFDARRGVVVRYQQAFGIFEYDGFEWASVHTATQPSAELSLIGMTYDPRLGVVVLLGTGQDGCETWTYDGVAWRPMDGPEPPRRFFSALTYDGNIDALLLVAGRDGAGEPLRDAWRLDLDGWHPIGADLPFGERLSPLLAFDPSISRSVLFGGFGADDETWLFDGSEWTRAEPTTRPPPRDGASLAWDATRERLVMFGGETEASSPDAVAETWIFAGGDWTLLDIAPGAGPRAQHAMVYDAVRGVLLVVGGECTRVFDSQKPAVVGCEQGRPFALGERWEPVLDVAGPRPRRAAAADYAASLGATVLFGGVALDDGDVVLGDTWIGGGSDWYRWTGPERPPPRRDAQLVFDAGRARVVLFGGVGAGDAPLSDTWELGPDAWVRRSDVQGPSARYGHAMAYDRQRGVIVLYGGRDGRGILGDQWEYDGVAWTEVDPAPPPGPRFDAAMAYDADRRVLVLYGGQTTVLNEQYPPHQATWELSDAWRMRPEPFGSLSGRHQMVFDSARGRLVMVQTGHFSAVLPENILCGAGQCRELTLWELEPTGWRERTPLGSVPESAVRDLTHIVFDAARGEISLAERSGWIAAYRGEGDRERCEVDINAPVDPDGDQLVLCDDPDCAGIPPCQAARCDAVPADGDGLCADPRCGGSICGAGRHCVAGVCGCEPGQIEEVCDDGEDQDCDDLIDCADPDCRDSAPCADGCLDPDGDGYGVGRDCLGKDCDPGDPAQFLATPRFRDADGDGAGDPIERLDCSGVEAPAGFAARAGDCDDTDASCVSGACCPVCEDQDGDGYGIGARCAGPDCDDWDPSCNATGDACCDVPGAR